MVPPDAPALGPGGTGVADAIVIGAGPNGLVAANRLADAGWDVVVLEANAAPGGAVRSGEILRPGFVHDRYSSFYPLGVASPVLASLGLEEHGVRWCHARYAVAHPTLDGRAAAVAADVRTTAATLAAYAPDDAAAYAELHAVWDRIGDALLDALLGPFPPVAPAARLAAALGPVGAADFTRFAMLPMRRLVHERFRGEGAALLFAGNAAHSDVPSSAAPSGFLGWMFVGLAQSVGFPAVAGGSGNLTRALVERLERRGGRVECNARVDRVIVRGGRAVAVRTADGRELAATRAVLADTSAPALYQHLVGEDELPAAFVRRIRRFEWDPATVKVDWVLDRPVPWADEATRDAATVHLVESLDWLAECETQLGAGFVPRRPFLLAGQPDRADPTRCPAGTGTLWAYTHVPQHARGDAGGRITGRWDDHDAARMADRMEEQIERFAPGFRSTVVARHVATPPMLERENANLRNGAVGGGTAQLHQQLVFRPTLGLGGARTPVAGLFLASASAHPGGGVHGACGNNAARAAIGADRRRRIRHGVTRRRAR